MKLEKIIGTERARVSYGGQCKGVEDLPRKVLDEVVEVQRRLEKEERPRSRRTVRHEQLEEANPEALLGQFGEKQEGEDIHSERLLQHEQFEAAPGQPASMIVIWSL